MRIHTLIIITGLIVLALVLAGCTTSSPPAQPTVPPTMSAPAEPVPTPTPLPYPNALTPGTYAAFGSGNRQGLATLYRSEVKNGYNWTSPSWNSPSEQAANLRKLGFQAGFNRAEPAPGSQFLFLYLRVQAPGTEAAYAPSPQQCMVSAGGKMYPYHPIESSDVTIEGVNGNQYDYQIGTGGTGGYVQAGESNLEEGYLIYEIPAPIIPEKTFLVCNLDASHQGVWKLG